MTKVRWTHFILSFLLLAAAPLATQAQTYTVLYNLGANPGDPLYPQYIGSIAQGRDGSLYTTTPQGGAHGVGAIFKVSPGGQMTVLHSFTTALDGNGPQGGLTLGSDGNFYGTTYSGGPRSGGTVFKITPSGTLTVLHAFAVSSDGGYPISAPVEGPDGNFYGITSYNNSLAFGTVYRVSPTGSFTALFVASRTTAPLGGYGSSLIAASDGNFYGTFLAGGKGFGTVFKMTPSGQATALHIFVGTDGAKPYSVMQASDGNLYGTASAGGSTNYGVVFKLTPSGGYTVLHTFTATDGIYPVGGLCQATDGNLYGTAKGGGLGHGTIYRIKPDGTNFVVVHAISIKVNEGYAPLAAVIQYTDGSFYGDTYGGGTKGTGLFFNLKTGLAPFLSLVPASGTAGASVGIIGQGLTGTKSVTFNGVSASFTVVSDTYLTTTVPAGATTGPIKVTTPAGALASSGPFQVAP